MSREITVRAGLSVRKGSLYYPFSLPQFVTDQIGVGGPLPGAFLVSPYGTVLDVSSLDVPYWTQLQNLDATYDVEWGLWDGLKFRPIGYLPAGQGYPFCFSPNLFSRYDDTGTGTTLGTEMVMFKADIDAPAPIWIKVDAFER